MPNKALEATAKFHTEAEVVAPASMASTTKPLETQALVHAAAGQPLASMTQEKPRHLQHDKPILASVVSTPEFVRTSPGHEHLGIRNYTSFIVGSAGDISLASSLVRARSPLEGAPSMAGSSHQGPAAATAVTVLPDANALTTVAPDAGGSDQSWLEWLFWTLVYISALGGCVGGAFYVFIQAQNAQRPALTGRLGELQRTVQSGGAIGEQEESQAERRKKQKSAYRYSAMNAHQNSGSDETGAAKH